MPVSARVSVLRFGPFEVAGQPVELGFLVVGEAEGGMHFCGQRSVAVELIDPASGAVLPWEEGVRGEAVYTTFAREATPVLRYRSADHLVVTAMSCPCGRTSPRIRCVGRTDDMLIYKAMNVFPSAIRDVVVRRFPDAVEPYLRIWKDRAGTRWAQLR